MLFLVTLLSCCLSFQNQTVTHKQTYRSDQFRPGVISEYIEVTRSASRGEIIEMKYWSLYRSGNDTEKSDAENIKLKDVESYQKEEHGWKGKLQFGEKGDWLTFRIVEGVFEIEHLDSEVQTFEMEE